MNEQSPTQPTKKVIDYFSTKESKWGYTLFLKGTKHFGYYPEGKENISISEAQHLMEAKLAEKLSLPAESLVLDAGCGEGKVAIYLAQKYGYNIKGVDLLDFSLQKANEEITSLGLSNKIEVKQGDYSKLEFADNIFDGAYTMETLVHVANYTDALKGFYRVLKPGGKLVLFEYSLRNWDKLTLKQQEMGKLIIEESGMHALPHFQDGTFKTLLKETGFTNIFIEDATQRIMPMLKIFYKNAVVPYQIIKLLGLQKKFVNTTSAVEGYKMIQTGNYGSYNIISAIK